MREKFKKIHLTDFTVYFMRYKNTHIPLAPSSVSFREHHGALDTGTDKHAHWDWVGKCHHKRSRSRLLKPPRGSR